MKEMFYIKKMFVHRYVNYLFHHIGDGFLQLLEIFIILGIISTKMLQDRCCMCSVCIVFGTCNCSGEAANNIGN